MILRFRDLVTAPGGTINQHKAISDAEGYVWWGWWNKSGERVATGTFEEFLQKINADGPLKVYLFDSGRSLIYSVDLLDIKWDPALNPSRSPEEGKTPQYYRDETYKAWFKLTDFEEVGEATLNDLTCVRVDEFFTDGESRYTAFYGKKIYSAVELRQQDRTIWFVRVSIAGDLSHYVSLLDAVSFSPEDFTQTYRVHKARSLLWMSDLHFSVDANHRFPLQRTATQSPLWLATENALKSVDCHEDIAGALLSGDFAWKADAEEFVRARTCVSELASKLRLRDYDFLTCPGNHDVAFSATPASSGTEITNTTEVATEAYRSFYKNLFYKEPNGFMSAGRKILLGSGIPVEIVSLNTSLLQQYPNSFQGYGFVGQAQLDDAAEVMGWDPNKIEDLPVRIVMMHHHLLPVTYREMPNPGWAYSVTLDSEAISRWLLKHRVKLLLHGHMHQPFVTKVERYVDSAAQRGATHSYWVLGIGSAGVSADHLGEVGVNMVGLLSFKRDGARFRTIKVHPVDPPQILWDVTIDL